ncbi:MAG: oligosaccharide flippase family protein, partial [Mobilitalea sp.]
MLNYNEKIEVMKTIKNYLYNVSYQIVSIVIPIITTPYISRVLKVDGVGQYSVSAAIINYFILFGMLGIASYGSREIAYVRDDVNKISKTFWEINLLRFITMGIALVVYAIFILVFLSDNLKLLYLVQIFTLFASLFDISWYFIGLEDFKKTSIRNIIVKLFSVIFIFILVKSKSD